MMVRSLSGTWHLDCVEGGSLVPPTREHGLPYTLLAMDRDDELKFFMNVLSSKSFIIHPLYAMLVMLA